MPEAPDRTERRLRLAGWLLAVLLAGAIFLESSSADVGGLLSGLPPGSDKVGHAILYALLSASLTLASGRPWLGILLATLYGGTDEFHQSFVDGRSSDLLDLLADFVGASLGALAVVFLRRRIARRRIQ